jgi:hypothetical protein
MSALGSVGVGRCWDESHMCSKGAMTGEMTLFRHTFLNRFI